MRNLIKKFQSLSTFFVSNDEELNSETYKALLKTQFMLAYYGGMDLFFVQNMSVEDRSYFAELLVEEKKKEEESYKKASRNAATAPTAPRRPNLHPRIKL